MSELNELLKAYWTNKKCGKHSPEDLIMEHGLRLKTYAKIDYDDIFEQINQNVYSINSMPRNSWSNFLKEAHLEEYLKPEYTKSALEVQLARPAIGIGEFLFVSCFGNLVFSSETGDLLDIKHNKKIEFKGNRATFSGEKRGNISYKEMNNDILSTISSQFTEYNEVENSSTFDRTFCKMMDDKLKQYPEKIEKVISLCQNVMINGKSSQTLTKMFSELYKQKNDLFKVVAAMHCYAYLISQKADYMIVANDKGYICFDKPNDANDAWNIINNLNISSWAKGNKGITLSL